MSDIEVVNSNILELAGSKRIETNDISDGYHTFGELYKHRIHLFIALCNVLSVGEHPLDSMKVCKSKYHHDGSKIDGWFIMQLWEIDRYTGSEKVNTQISYHLPMEYWNQCGHIDTVDKANIWDGHTSEDVLVRLLK